MRRKMILSLVNAWMAMRGTNALMVSTNALIGGAHALIGGTWTNYREKNVILIIGTSR